MPDDSALDEDKEEKLKAALWLAVGRAVDRELVRRSSADLNATPQFIAALTELTWAQIGLVARDLERFAKHADRTTITVPDVLLLARRNERLEAMLRRFVDETGIMEQLVKAQCKIIVIEY